MSHHLKLPVSDQEAILRFRSWLGQANVPYHNDTLALSDALLEYFNSLVPASDTSPEPQPELTFVGEPLRTIETEDQAVVANLHRLQSLDVERTVGGITTRSSYYFSDTTTEPDAEDDTVLETLQDYGVMLSNHRTELNDLHKEVNRLTNLVHGKRRG